ncbi:MAG: hypothetical protein QGG19_20630 [Alphaproteobacteria bacterium]|jgi:hypothetical protein|nr:hypothetical protein [Alphaproteobacteria bacterium]MDP6253915.1 hypothetical protein [Alphaproteobacteria bacterium]MDP7053035.1 hypothetical protein [Alphaproteobacteria bacterium]MDP7228962.1 hypothetical protein [Alphaproteobacteria bacterium]MDP7460171.1 hypothetical protein [Alphaproteobacteria bacterium]|tara:strand:+ start:5714 stop:6118 length:405 start_codon:yes stop_codon:yes gene_type:complete
MNSSPELPLSIKVRTDAGDFLVEARAVVIGDDVLVYIWGGEKPHIGAVAAVQPRPSLADPSKTSATASVLTYPGHKEDEVVKYVGEALSAACNANVVVTAGIHWDNLGPSDIETIRSRIGEITEKLVTGLQGAP